MSMPSSESRLYGIQRAGDADPATIHPGRSRMPIRLVTAVLALLLLFGASIHLAPAIRAGLREGVRGTWVATSETCSKSACLWNGKFVLPDGDVTVRSTQFSGQLPLALHAGSKLPALNTGEAGLVYSANGSDLWISLLVGIVISLLGLYWSLRRPVRDFLRRRREPAAAAAASPPA